MGISTLACETAALTSEDWEKVYRQAVKEQELRQEPEINKFDIHTDSLDTTNQNN